MPDDRNPEDKLSLQHEDDREETVLNSTDASVLTSVSKEELDMEEEPTVTSLARQFTSQSNQFPRTVTEIDNNPFLSSHIPALDPKSPEFSPVKWTKALLHATSRDLENVPPKTLGVSHRNLSAYGYGSDVNYQADVFSVYSRLIDLAMSALGRQQKKVQILRNFDGLVRAGEMLLVLGRPGRYA
jgi:ATP-binding cassette subfamily G (WHITE) protein 2 (PDR)